jgi:hypothetical protein
MLEDGEKAKIFMEKKLIVGGSSRPTTVIKKGGNLLEVA